MFRWEFHGNDLVKEFGHVKTHATIKLEGDKNALQDNLGVADYYSNI